MFEIAHADGFSCAPPPAPQGEQVEGIDEGNLIQSYQVQDSRSQLRLQHKQVLLQVGSISTLSHVCCQLHELEQVCPVVSCTGIVSRAVLKDKIVSDGRQLKEVSDCDGIETTEEGYHIVHAFDLSESPVDKAQRLVGNHVDLINDQVIESLALNLQYLVLRLYSTGRFRALWMVRPMLKADTPVGAISMQCCPAPRCIRSRCSRITLMMWLSTSGDESLSGWGRVSMVPIWQLWSTHVCSMTAR